MSASRRLPNFSALRAFEAAARHENFSRAAEELHLTHGAISHQVRALEEELGRPLFVRHGRQVKITSDALKFAQFLGKSFGDIAAAADAMRASAVNQRLTISSIPSFAARWLAPRLGRFIELYPDIEVVLQSSGQLQDLARDGIDVGIRFGRGNYPGLVVQRLMGDVYYPVVSPHYRGGQLPAAPQELSRHTLLRSVEPWSPWLRAAGVDMAEPSGGLMFEDLSMLIRSAADGNGVALVRHVVAMQEIASGQLRRLFDTATPCPDEYFFVSPPGAAGRPQVQAFRDWLLEEIAAFQRQQA
ncbi:transcriptional regulator GcvA [Duganella sp. BJB488]|uniref:transcriptional regulator GcvA n=1 Tax=unclassified Duganella TaxID=2636909 RepID=UPI000E347569|nr:MULTISPECIES: transcriptional regulator GcvA [unclassified Duganella]RFP24525.1 transcriptional regulator GcvA [Duganella sp. BJB489]RFP26885.1 transcriptional regulator GcvA [Duganella sp. BJB488]RFP34382.1 transcriptional regulator GcvA [Duganella sp. BJB480]